MGIVRVRISNFKSIKRMDFDLTSGSINCLLGKNGVGKTTIDKAILYFYEVANNQYSVCDIIDKKNPYIQKATIEVVFDFNKLNEKRERNIYVDNNIKEFEPYIVNNQVAIRLTQYKDGNIEWYPLNDKYKVKSLLKIFPVYMINTREVTLDSWSKLWDVVSDIAITGIKENDPQVREIMSYNFENIYGKKYMKAIEAIDKVLKSEKISINERDFKKRFKNALMANVGGEIFMLDEHNIDFYSDGINSLKFQALFIGLISELSTIAWKEILIILDEPEISLHPQYIEELVMLICKACDKVDFILATHSTRLVSSLLRETLTEKAIAFFQVYSKDGYTKIRRIQDIVSDKDKYLVRDNEAESYFANGIMFVEGQTEIHLYRNKNIVELFPILKKITIYNTASNDSATKLILPKTNRPTIPFIVLIDMDKVLEYSDKKNMFYIKKGNTTVNPLGNDEIKIKENYLYYDFRKEITHNRRKQIEHYLKKAIVVDKNHFYNTDVSYEKMIDLVKMYCKYYRTIVAKTTSEGAIICAESIEKIYEWLEEDYWDENKKLDYMNEINSFDKKIQLSITRGLFHGKTDYLMKFNKKSIPPHISAILDKYKSGSKTDGWIFQFYSWYFKKYMNMTSKENKELFAKNFPEINESIQYIGDMLK